MLEQLTDLSLKLGVSAEILLLIGVGTGVMFVFLGLAALLNARNPAAERIAAITPEARHLKRQDRALLRPSSSQQGKLKNPLVPSDARKRTELQNKLAQAGFTGPRALSTFTAVRAVLGLALPGLLLLLIVLTKTHLLTLPFGAQNTLVQFSNMQVFQLLTVLVALGFFAPVYWLQSRVAERKRRIEENFPNALDLIQISVDAGLGFDAAMTRVGNELADVSPDVAFEFLTVQRQVQAGRSRDIAMQDMADRTGVETVRSFSNAVQQSMKFGTSMSDALQTFAAELREYRETKAQEMANKLPVKVSAVLASLMLPALILLTVGPVLIRYIRFYGG